MRIAAVHDTPQLAATRLPAVLEPGKAVLKLPFAALPGNDLNRY
jgi:hypothetical protein